MFTILRKKESIIKKDEKRKDAFPPISIRRLYPKLDTINRTKLRIIYIVSDVKCYHFYIIATIIYMTNK